MLIFNVVTLLLLGWMFARWLLLKREIKSVTTQLTYYRNSDSLQKIEVSLIDKDMEQLTVEVNLLMDTIAQETAEKRRTEHELKQAVANISHDLRTPLTSILGYLQLLNGEDLTIEERVEYQGVAISRGNRLKSLLNDFFELSVIESMDYELSIKRVNMNDLLTNTLLGYYDSFMEKDKEPLVTIPEHSLYIMADESAVKRVIENLLNNALSHGKGNVSVALEQFGRYIRLIICNEVYVAVDMRMIFDRFYTEDQVRTGLGKGLGLSITKSLMEKMRGSIRAECDNAEISMICEWMESRPN
ncbi:sensor histidine kinase [Paenibacillus antarcticus]|uniref:histidine kinase n=1 Tax=Paenibacillus antarcticus TaxID=253703 RepID=A0A168QZH6_9BACL|nr:HAMP domain-containing sensor histidine kinase [Paenibacillus antarcticus]OAB48396.1 hypothetical protein PBAT_01830 [Paenibacillus antarcticus]